MREERNLYGYTKAEVEQLNRRQEQLEKDEQERQKWNNFLDAMCGTGIITKTH